jgi:hypothetical protein
MGAAPTAPGWLFPLLHALPPSLLLLQVTALSEEELAQRIRADRVDILVELTGEAVLWGVAGGLFVVGEGGGGG